MNWVCRHERQQRGQLGHVLADTIRDLEQVLAKRLICATAVSFPHRRPLSPPLPPSCSGLPSVEHQHLRQHGATRFAGRLPGAI